MFPKRAGIQAGEKEKKKKSFNILKPSQSYTNPLSTVTTMTGNIL
jgi:hypothetical protein